MTTRRPFLTAEWRYLAMLNYRVEPALLAPRVPRGTALDAWRGNTYVSVVGFRFLGTRVLGLPVPFHRDFDEVNLRFYVRREVAGEARRGVVFVKEIVPRRAIALAARLAYNEPYVALPMTSTVPRGPAADPGRVEYAWRSARGWNRLAVTAVGAPAAAPPGSEEEFITEHYWGYTRQRDGGTVEYHVEHPPWRVWPTRDARLACDVAGVYGDDMAAALAAAPSSAFLAEGSRITVFAPARIH